MDTDIISPIVVRLDRKSVIQILSCVGIDREDTLISKILTNLELPLRDPGRSINNED